jgi:hypothetical protein
MSRLLENQPYGTRDETELLRELNELTLHHLAGCPAYARVWPGWTTAATAEELPYLHAGVFKRIEFKTIGEGIRHERALKSSATTGGVSSRITLDATSSQLQSRSTEAILKDFLGPARRPLLVLDSSRSLQARGEISARVAAAMSLRPLASEIFFLLDDPENPASVNWERARCAIGEREDILVYGFTWMLWLAWGAREKPDEIAKLLAGKRVQFVHSGGWKKLEALKVSRDDFSAALLRGLAPDSRVLDYYGLVEQVGIIYPLCPAGARHAPVWADVLVRDALTLRVLADGEAGMLQLLNPLARGAPYHSVLTEDLGRIIPGLCPCGRAGKRFDLLGRLPKAELRGCANV